MAKHSGGDWSRTGRRTGWNTHPSLVSLVSVVAYGRWPGITPDRLSAAVRVRWHAVVVKLGGQWRLAAPSMRTSVSGSARVVFHGEAPVLPPRHFKLPGRRAFGIPGRGGTRRSHPFGVASDRFSVPVLDDTPHCRGDGKEYRRFQRHIQPRPVQHCCSYLLRRPGRRRLSVACSLLGRVLMALKPTAESALKCGRSPEAGRALSAHLTVEWSKWSRSADGPGRS